MVQVSENIYPFGLHGRLLVLVRLLKTAVFFAIFMFLSFLLHLLYRVKTNKFKRSWLDFVVVEEENEINAKSIGKLYYSAIILNAIIALVISQVFP